MAAIAAAIGASADLTTGPVFVVNGARTFYTKVLNNTNATQTVTVRVYDIAQFVTNVGMVPFCPKVLFAQTTTTVAPCCTAEIQLPAVAQNHQYELQVLGLSPGMYVSSFSTATTPGGTKLPTPIDGSIFINRDFAPLIQTCTPA